jgi:hypothetical protein
MSLSDAFKSKAQSVVDVLSATPIGPDTWFVRSARPFAIDIGILALATIGILAVQMKDAITAGAVVLTIGAVLQQFGAQRSRDKQADMTATIENTKTITTAASVDMKTTADAKTEDKKTEAGKE